MAEGGTVSPTVPDCPICYSELRDNLAVPGGCGHVFHSHCLSQWRDAKDDPQKTLTCPICRKKGNKMRIHYSLPNVADVAGEHKTIGSVEGEYERYQDDLNERNNQMKSVHKRYQEEINKGIKIYKQLKGECKRSQHELKNILTANKKLKEEYKRYQDDLKESLEINKHLNEECKRSQDELNESLNINKQLKGEHKRSQDDLGKILTINKKLKVEHKTRSDLNKNKQLKLWQWVDRST